ncbi:MAG: hypothetical protein PHW22_05400, partial [Bacilli bacterium]|nr:hypothetical protein [Bacilli bacterium]
ASEMRFFSYRVINPSVNYSQNSYTFDHGNFRVGFNQIKGFNYRIGEGIINEREKNGLFKSLGDFIIRLPESLISETELQVLVNAGALDEFGYSRQQMNAKLAELTLARSFAESKEDLPLMEKDKNVIDVSAFIKEYASLGAVLSISIQKLIVDEANFFSLYVLVEQPREYNESYIVKAITNYQTRTLFLPKGEAIEKNDVISIVEDNRASYYHSKIINYKKEKLI